MYTGIKYPYLQVAPFVPVVLVIQEVLVIPEINNDLTNDR